MEHNELIYLFLSLRYIFSLNLLLEDRKDNSSARTGWLSMIYGSRIHRYCTLLLFIFIGVVYIALIFY